MLADSSFLVSLFLPSDTNHEKAKKLYSNCRGYMLIPISVFEETSNIVIYKRGMAACIEMMEQILLNEDIIVYYPDEAEMLEVFELMKKKQKKMSVIDYEVAYLAAQKKEKLLCFDKQILSLAKNLFIEPA